MIDPRKLALRIYPEAYCICRFGPDDPVPEWTNRASFCSITRTNSELSVVCREELIPPQRPAERGWRLLAVQGPLDLAMIGVMARLATTLADANVSIFVVSTFDTDYLLVREEDLQRAVDALTAAEYVVTATE